MMRFPYNRPDFRASQSESRSRGLTVRALLGVVVIGVGIVNVCLHHPWHRVLGVIAIAVGLLLCALVWFP
jgi:heme A synthase